MRYYPREGETLNRRVHRAVAYVSHPSQNRTGRARWNLKAPLKRDQYYISVGYTDKPYGRSTHTSAFLSHITRGMLLVWEHGVLLGTQAIWRCNAKSIQFILLDEPTSTICPACRIDRNY